MSIYDHTVESESRPTGMGCHGLPDSPALEMEIAADVRAEMDSAFGYDQQPTDEEIDRMAEAAHARNGGDDDRTPPAGALPLPEFPAVGTRGWVELVAQGLPDDVLMFYIDKPEQTTIPDTDADTVQDVYSAELVRRLESRGVRFAA
jgi:hypothetical protein